MRFPSSASVTSRERSSRHRLGYDAEEDWAPSVKTDASTDTYRDDASRFYKQRHNSKTAEALSDAVFREIAKGDKKEAAAFASIDRVPTAKDFHSLDSAEYMNEEKSRAGRYEERQTGFTEYDSVDEDYHNYGTSPAAKRLQAAAKAERRMGWGEDDREEEERDPADHTSLTDKRNAIPDEDAKKNHKAKIHTLLETSTATEPGSARPVRRTQRVIPRAKVEAKKKSKSVSGKSNSKSPLKIDTTETSVSSGATKESKATKDSRMAGMSTQKSVSSTDDNGHSPKRSPSPPPMKSEAESSFMNKYSVGKVEEDDAVAVPEPVESAHNETTEASQSTGSPKKTKITRLGGIRSWLSRKKRKSKTSEQSSDSKNPEAASMVLTTKKSKEEKVSRKAASATVQEIPKVESEESTFLYIRKNIKDDSGSEPKRKPDPAGDEETSPFDDVNADAAPRIAFLDPIIDAVVPSPSGESSSSGEASVELNKARQEPAPKEPGTPREPLEVMENEVVNEDWEDDEEPVEAETDADEAFDPVEASREPPEAKPWIDTEKVSKFGKKIEAGWDAFTLSLFSSLGAVANAGMPEPSPKDKTTNTKNNKGEGTPDTPKRKNTSKEQEQNQKGSTTIEAPVLRKKGFFSKKKEKDIPEKDEKKEEVAQDELKAFKPTEDDISDYSSIYARRKRELKAKEDAKKAEQERIRESIEKQYGDTNSLVEEKSKVDEKSRVSSRQGSRSKVRERVLALQLDEPELAKVKKLVEEKEAAEFAPSKSGTEKKANLNLSALAAEDESPKKKEEGIIPVSSIEVPSDNPDFQYMEEDDGSVSILGLEKSAYKKHGEEQQRKHSTATTTKKNGKPSFLERFLGGK